jgi:hypothetical protein
MLSHQHSDCSDPGKVLPNLSGFDTQLFQTGCRTRTIRQNRAERVMALYVLSRMGYIAQSLRLPIARITHDYVMPRVIDCLARGQPLSLALKKIEHRQLPVK